MTLKIERVEDWLGRPVVGSDGEKIGKLQDLIFAADSTPLFGAVSTGLFGRRTSLVPLADATLAPDHITIPYEKGMVKDAPQLDDPGEMSGDIEDATADHYGHPRRERTPEQAGYVSAEDRARRAEEARLAEAHAVELEERADALAGELKSARAAAAAAQERVDTLAAEHRDAVEQAREARSQRAALSPT